MNSVDTHDQQQPAPGWVPTTHPGVLGWVADMADLLGPDNVVWCDGSRAEWDRLTSVLVERGTFVPLTGKPNSFWCASGCMKPAPPRPPQFPRRQIQAADRDEHTGRAAFRGDGPDRRPSGPPALTRITDNFAGHTTGG